MERVIASALNSADAGSRLIEAIQLLARCGADVGALEVAPGPEAVEISRGQRKLVALPSPGEGDPPPLSLALMASEIATFLLPLDDEVARRIGCEIGELRIDPLVEISAADSTIVVDSRYATLANGAGRALYPSHMRHRGFVRQSVAVALRQVQAELSRLGFGLKLWDGYRPHAIQRLCVDPQLVPDAASRNLFVPPSLGSNHARGCAVDLTLIDRATGQECVMPTGFDSPAAEASSDATDGLTREQIGNRQLLQSAMRRAGFYPIPPEWWHFNHRPDRKQALSRTASDLYAVLDIPFEELMT